METTHYHCSAEWHFSHLKGKGAHTASMIYTFALHLSKKHGVFYASIPRLAEYFGVDEKTVRKALHLLVVLGFLEIARQEAGASVRYRPVLHSVWKTLPKNAGRCAEKSTMPWADEPQDRLAVDLHAISGGRFTTWPNVVKAMRKTGHSTEAIHGHFRAFVDFEQPTGKVWGDGFAGRFIKYLRAQQVFTNNP
jgi:hypothetical protein